MKFRLANFPRASNQSVPLNSLNRLARRVRDAFTDGDGCSECGTKIKSYFFKSERILRMEQCRIVCRGCGSIFHFLCYMEAVGATKGDGAVYRWPRGSRKGHDIAPCPKCKKQEACHIMLDGARKTFADDEIVRAGE